MSLIAVVLTQIFTVASAQEYDPYAPPEVIDAPSCVCPATTERPDVIFSGFVIDAEVTLGSDRRSVEDRMATIFDVKWSNNGEIEGRTRLWHTTLDATCGVTFDYGKKYSVAARWLDGDLETDRCLMEAAD
ncbi:hypothetical protein PUV54_09615 [Hyphococcus flavus]|uniref:Uncharacterized protein n=1 Tax=Hyphococcus flavus TaxID=1866326 RepID=A0AAE9ZC81_9PROT|nr:hypothetical protein [Hyphococcus flavus]WDI30217.1 hypothetical protein PUV54_09615 [Hyphococcus flavus]